MTYRNVSRREILGMALGIGTAVVGGFAQTANHHFTPPLSLGPFYPLIKPLDMDADLTIVKGKKARAEGKIIHIAGRVIDITGAPVKNARIEIWQADAHGRYVHRSDAHKAVPDDNFQGYAVLKSDDLGRYRFKTVMPAPYPAAPFLPGVRTPHIHFDVSGKYDRVITQMFFPDEPLNKTDPILQNIRSETAKSAVFAKLAEAGKDISADERLFVWDIVMTSG